MGQWPRCKCFGGSTVLHTFIVLHQPPLIRWMTCGCVLQSRRVVAIFAAKRRGEEVLQKRSPEDQVMAFSWSYLPNAYTHTFRDFSNFANRSSLWLFGIRKDSLRRDADAVSLLLYQLSYVYVYDRIFCIGRWTQLMIGFAWILKIFFFLLK